MEIKKLKKKINSIVQEHTFSILFYEQKSSQCLKTRRNTKYHHCQTRIEFVKEKEKNRIKYETKAIGTKQSRTILNVVDYVKTP